MAGARRTVLSVRVLPSWTGPVGVPGRESGTAEPARRGCARRTAAAIAAALPGPDLDVRPVPAVHVPAPVTRRSEVTRAA